MKSREARLAVIKGILGRVGEDLAFCSMPDLSQFLADCMNDADVKNTALVYAALAALLLDERMRRGKPLEGDALQRHRRTVICGAIRQTKADLKCRNRRREVPLPATLDPRDLTQVVPGETAATRSIRPAVLRARANLTTAAFAIAHHPYSPIEKRVLELLIAGESVEGIAHHFSVLLDETRILKISFAIIRQVETRGAIPLSQDDQLLYELILGGEAPEVIVKQFKQLTSVEAVRTVAQDSIQKLSRHLVIPPFKRARKQPKKGASK